MLDEPYVGAMDVYPDGLICSVPFTASAPSPVRPPPRVNVTPLFTVRVFPDATVTFVTLKLADTLTSCFISATSLEVGERLSNHIDAVLQSPVEMVCGFFTL